jgi:hypothetical protein
MGTTMSGRVLNRWIISTKLCMTPFTNSWLLCHVAIRPIATRTACETVGQAGVSALATSLCSDTGPLYGRSPLVDLVLEKTGEIFRAAPLRSDDLDTETLEPLTK